MEGRSTFRPAAKADASALAVLVDIAGEGLPAYLWSTLKAPGNRSSRSAASAPHGRRAASPTAMPWSPRSMARSPPASSATGSTIPTISVTSKQSLPLVRPLVLLEAKAPGSWYVNVLATFPEFRRQGSAWRCSASPRQKAREAGAPALSVIVAGENVRAARLYAAAGYEARAAEPIFAFPGCPHGGDWLLMVKALQLAAPARWHEVRLVLGSRSISPRTRHDSHACR